MDKDFYGSGSRKKYKEREKERKIKRGWKKYERVRQYEVKN